MDIHKFTRLLEQRQFPIDWPGQWVNGAWLAGRPGAVSKTSHNPNTGEALVTVNPGKDDVAQVVAAAFDARKTLATKSLPDRLDFLRRFRETLADFQEPAKLVLRLEAGKPRWEAETDLDEALSYLDWVAKHGEEAFESLLAPARLGPTPGRFTMLPIGVTAAYLPFSTPFTSFVFYFAASMLAGCPLIVNSSSHALLANMFLALIAQELNLNAASVSFVFGNFSSFKQLIGDKRIAAILYTGSREHCDTIRVESRQHLGRQIVLQSGGKNAVIVHSSADLNQAVRCVLHGALTSAGQRCTSTSRVFVYRSLLPQFLEQLVASIRNVKIARTDITYSNPADEPMMGPLYSSKAVEKFLRFQTMANRESEKTLLWGRSVESLAGGNFVVPGVHYLTKFDNQSAYQGNVLFCPDIAIYDYDVLETAIEHINTTDASFAVSFVGDPAIIEERRQLFLAPNLVINAPTVESIATLPLAGRLHSGHHRFHGPGIALYLCYPQVLVDSLAQSPARKLWPWSLA